MLSCYFMIFLLIHNFENEWLQQFYRYLARTNPEILKHSFMDKLNLCFSISAQCNLKQKQQRFNKNKKQIFVNKNTASNYDDENNSWASEAHSCIITLQVCDTFLVLDLSWCFLDIVNNNKTRQMAWESFSTEKGSHNWHKMACKQLEYGLC